MLDESARLTLVGVPVDAFRAKAFGISAGRGISPGTEV